MLLISALAILAAVKRSAAAAIATLIGAAVFFYGIINLPWIGIVAAVTALAWNVGGRNLAIGVFLGMAYLLLSGIWEYAILSIYLCGIAVILSFLVGSTVGIWAAHNNTVSRIIRPINDTLQTMPLFVLLNSHRHDFQGRDFTALIAICFYAVVPAQRYAENALRGLPADVIEAARCMGCTPWQLCARQTAARPARISCSAWARPSCTALPCWSSRRWSEPGLGNRFMLVLATAISASASWRAWAWR